jgi:hypothetical protein
MSDTLPENMNVRIPSAGGRYSHELANVEIDALLRDPQTPASELDALEDEALRRRVVLERNKPDLVPRARLVGVDIPFGDLLMLFIKVGFAAVPAVIILAIAWSVIGGVLAGVLAGLSHR